MLPRSNTRPVLAALGTATVLTLGAVALPVAAFAVDPSPTAGEEPAPDPSSSEPASDPPTDPPPDSTPPDTPPPDTTPPDTPPPTTPPPDTSPPDTPPPTSGATPQLSITLSLSANAATPGGAVVAMARVASQQAVAHHAVLRVTAPSTKVTVSGSLGDLGAQRLATAVVQVPASHGFGPIKVTASLSADHATVRSVSQTFNVVAVGTPGAADASGLPPGVTSVPGLPAGLSIPGVTAPLGAAAQLPVVTGQQPAVAPGAEPDGTVISLKSGVSYLGLDEVSYRLLCTQVAWLAALLVAISLLLTRLRLRRRRPVRATARRSRRA